MKNSFLTFKGNGSFTLGLAHDRQWDGKVEHSTDGTSWAEWDGSEIKSAASGEDHFLYLRGKNKYFSDGGYENTTFVLDGNATKIECTGNIMSLLDYESPDTAKMDDSCFCGLFSFCSKLTKAPELPATALTEGCYSNLFFDCTGLIEAPKLPATVLAEGCYEEMFERCTGLTKAPELPATALAEDCYRGMFKECTGLTEAPELPATVLAENCYFSMFQGCTGLTECPALPATALAEYCYLSMFQGCTGLTEAPVLPATALAKSCYGKMFLGCTGLTKTPELPATVLAEKCYQAMFYGCTSLTSIGKIAGGNRFEQKDYATLRSFDWMFFDCSSLNVVKKKEDPFIYIPGILGRYLFRKMFRNCKNNPKEKPGNAFKI